MYVESYQWQIGLEKILILPLAPCGFDTPTYHFHIWNCYDDSLHLGIITNLGLRRSCSVGETSLPEGEIETIVITNDPLIDRGSISINIFTSTISSQTLVHLLYLILVPKPQIGTCGLLVVLITPCS